LTNALALNLLKDENFEQLQDLKTLIEQMDMNVHRKGAQSIGPLIQKTSLSANKDGELQMTITFIRQANKFIHHVDSPYKMESIIKVPDCLYTRFIGEEDNMQFAYNKLNLTAYEEEIELTGETYTVFVDSNEEDGTITADIFMPKKSV
jgi:uncharacterized protein YecE (DUF72 family)